MKSIGAGILGFTSLICVSSTYADGIPPSIVRDSAKTTVKISAPYKDANKAFQTETGSGVLITESGDILTARHVIEGWTKLNDDERVSHPLIVKIGSIYGTEVPAEVTNTDPNPDTDLALVSLLRPQTNSFVSLCYLSKSPDGEALYAFGFPNQNNLTPLPGTFGTQKVKRVDGPP